MTGSRDTTSSDTTSSGTTSSDRLALTHLGHSCLLVELGGVRILIDPGTFSSGFTELTDLDAVLVTHQHFDHLDTDALPALLAANPRAVLRADAETTQQVGGDWVAVTPGESFEVGGVTVSALGGRHAVIHPDIPQIGNVAYQLGTATRPRAFLHPGDSSTVPDEAPDVLGLPTCAPWLKLSESIDYLRAVSPAVAVPIHEALLARPGMYYGHFDRLAPAGTDVHVLRRDGADTF